MSLQSLLSIARTALLTHQRAMTVTSHNVANASTPGYHRQRLQITATTPLLTPQGAIGRGVTDEGVLRARDRFLDASFRRESGGLGRSQMRQDLLGQVEAAMGEPSAHGVAASLDALFMAFGDLANDPTGLTPRELVYQSGMSFVQRLRSLDGRLTDAEREAAERLTAAVGQTNGMLSRIAELNARILSSGGPQGEPADLGDERDRLIDELSLAGDVRVIDRGDGTVGIMLGNTLVVDGAIAQTLVVQPQAVGATLALATGGAVAPGGGRLGALVELGTTTLPSVRARLDDLARAVVTEVNALHRSGYTATGATGVDFFDPAGVTAGTIALAPAVMASSTAVAAGGTPTPGDNAIALRIAALGNTPLASLGGVSLREHYTQLAASVGIDVRQAREDTDTQQALVDRADAIRAGITGVSVDEEMVELVAQQHAFAAASRIVAVADEMMDTVLRMI